MIRTSLPLALLAIITLTVDPGCASVGTTPPAPPLDGNSGLLRIEIVVRGLE